MSNYYPDAVVREAGIDTTPRPRIWLRCSRMARFLSTSADAVIG